MIDLADLLLDALAIPSLTGSEATYGAFLETQLNTIFGPHLVTLERQPVEADRFNLLACCGSDNPDILFSTHIDTVPPFLEPRISANKIFGRGACDTKGLQVSMLHAGQQLLEQGIHSFGFLFVVGEEVDHCGARVASQQLSLHPSGILLGEPTRNRIMRAQKGVLRVRISTRGVSGHSGYPESGKSATHQLLDFLQNLRHLELPSHPNRGTTTLNIGTLTGGEAANVIAPSASADIMIRTVSPTQVLLDMFSPLLSSDITLEVVHQSDPLDLHVLPGFETDVAHFFTDAGFLQALGPVTLLGPGDIRFAHSEREQITREELYEGSKLYQRAARTLLEKTNS